MPLPGVVAASLGIAAVLTPSMRNARDCLKPTSDSHAWATDMKTGTRLEAAQVFELFYVFDWPGHNDAASEGSWFATLTWPDHVIITKIRGDRVHPVDDTLAARYPGLSEFALASMAYSVLGKPLASLKLQFGASAVAPVGQGWKADDAHAQGVTIVGKTTNVLYDDAIRDANVVPYPRVVCRTAAENAVLLTLPPPPPRPPPPWSRPPPPAEWASRNPSRQHQPPPRSPSPDGPQVPSQAPPPPRMVLLGTGSHNSADDAAVATATATETATLSERPATEQTAAIPPPRPLRWMAMLLAFFGVAVALVRRLHARLQQTDRHTPVLDWVGVPLSPDGCRHPACRTAPMTALKADANGGARGFSQGRVHRGGGDGGGYDLEDVDMTDHVDDPPIAPRAAPRAAPRGLARGATHSKCMRQPIAATRAGVTRRGAEPATVETQPRGRALAATFPAAAAAAATATAAPGCHLKGAAGRRAVGSRAAALAASMGGITSRADQDGSCRSARARAGDDTDPLLD